MSIKKLYAGDGRFLGFALHSSCKPRFALAASRARTILPPVGDRRSISPVDDRGEPERNRALR